MGLLLLLGAQLLLAAAIFAEASPQQFHRSPVPRHQHSPGSQSPRRQFQLFVPPFVGQAATPVPGVFLLNGNGGGGGGGFRGPIDDTDNDIRQGGPPLRQPPPPQRPPPPGPPRPSIFSTSSEEIGPQGPPRPNNRPSPPPPQFRQGPPFRRPEPPPGRPFLPPPPPQSRPPPNGFFQNPTRDQQPIRFPTLSEDSFFPVPPPFFISDDPNFNPQFRPPGPPQVSNNEEVKPNSARERPPEAAREETSSRKPHVDADVERPDRRPQPRPTLPANRPPQTSRPNNQRPEPSQRPQQQFHQPTTQQQQRRPTPPSGRHIQRPPPQQQQQQFGRQPEDEVFEQHQERPQFTRPATTRQPQRPPGNQEPNFPLLEQSPFRHMPPERPSFNGQNQNRRPPQQFPHPNNQQQPSSQQFPPPQRQRPQQDQRGRPQNQRPPQQQFHPPQQQQFRQPPPPPPSSNRIPVLPSVLDSLHTESPELNVFIPGEAGRDYPTLGEIPRTGFSCRNRPQSTFLADGETRCQVVHVCRDDGNIDNFLCPNGTLFDEDAQFCNWWYRVPCGETSTEPNLINQGRTISQPRPAPPTNNVNNDGNQSPKGTPNPGLDNFFHNDQRRPQGPGEQFPPTRGPDPFEEPRFKFAPQSNRRPQHPQQPFSENLDDFFNRPGQRPDFQRPQPPFTEPEVRRPPQFTEPDVRGPPPPFTELETSTEVLDTTTGTEEISIPTTDETTRPLKTSTRPSLKITPRPKTTLPPRSRTSKHPRTRRPDPSFTDIPPIDDADVQNFGSFGQALGNEDESFAQTTTRKPGRGRGSKSRGRLSSKSRKRPTTTQFPEVAVTEEFFVPLDETTNFNDNSNLENGMIISDGPVAVREHNFPTEGEFDPFFEEPTPTLEEPETTFSTTTAPTTTRRITRPTRRTTTHKPSTSTRRSVKSSTTIKPKTTSRTRTASRKTTAKTTRKPFRIRTTSAPSTTFIPTSLAEEHQSTELRLTETVGITTPVIAHGDDTSVRSLEKPLSSRDPKFFHDQDSTPFSPHSSLVPQQEVFQSPFGFSPFQTQSFNGNNNNNFQQQGAVNFDPFFFGPAITRDEPHPGSLDRLPERGFQPQDTVSADPNGPFLVESTDVPSTNPSSTATTERIITTSSISESTTKKVKSKSSSSSTRRVKIHRTSSSSTSKPHKSSKNNNSTVKPSSRKRTKVSSATPRSDNSSFNKTSTVRSRSRSSSKSKSGNKLRTRTTTVSSKQENESETITERSFATPKSKADLFPTRKSAKSKFGHRSTSSVSPQSDLELSSTETIQLSSSTGIPILSSVKPE